ncbi:MAG TPA: ATPase domain-containing protein [Ktedonobacterales bacterium]|nr:ATPase domain-containing protein [Ktedonobacterales bacterium]
MTLQHWDPVELHPDAVAEHLLAALDRTGARRLVVDSIAELEHATARGDADRISDYLAALMVALRTRGVTALLIKEHRVTVASELDLSADPLSLLAENVLLLHQLEHHAKLHRVLSVIKMRYSAHDALLHEFAIEQPEGVQLIRNLPERRRDARSRGPACRGRRGGRTPHVERRR